MKKILCVFLVIVMLTGLTLPAFAEDNGKVIIRYSDLNAVDSVHYYNNKQPDNMFELLIKTTNITKYKYVYLQIDYDTEMLEYYFVSYLSEQCCIVIGNKTESGIWVKSTHTGSSSCTSGYSHAWFYIKKPGKVDFKITAYGIDLEGNRVDLDVEFKNVITEIKVKYDASECQQGDVNCDGTVTASDARKALRISARLEAPADEIRALADFDSNGKVTASDARTILRIAAGLE